MYHLEDINEHVTRYGNHILKLIQYRIQYRIGSSKYVSNGSTDLTDILNQDFLGDDASFE